MRLFIIPIVCFILYLFFIAPTLNAPLTTDELIWPIAAQSLMQSRNTVVFFGENVESSPPLYVNIQVFLYRSFGVSNFSSRLIGIFSVLFQLILFAFFAKTLFKDKNGQWKFVLVSSLLFITNPAVIQGSLIPFEDMTLLPLFLTIFGLVFMRLAKRNDLASALILGAIFAVCLWPKLTTPLVLIPSMLIYYFLNNDWKGIRQAVIVLMIGAFLFLLTWGIYSGFKGLNMLAPINYAVSAFLSKQVHRQAEPIFLSFSLNLIRFVLWFGLYSVLLGVMAVFKRASTFMAKRILEPVDFLVIYVLLVGISYTFVGGMTFGFPKYHYPVFSVLAILSALLFKDAWAKISLRDAVLYIGMTVLTAIYFYFVIRDPIYLFNFSIREMIVTDEALAKEAFIHFGHKIFLYALPSVAIFLLIRTYLGARRFFTCALTTLLIMILGANLALDVIQRRAPYLTRYCYGEEGTGDLIEYLGRNLSAKDAVLATCDIIYYLRQKGHDLSYVPDALWYHVDEVERMAEDPSVKFIIYSVGHNDIAQFRGTILNPVFQSALKRRFVLKKIGTHSVWERVR